MPAQDITKTCAPVQPAGRYGLCAPGGSEFFFARNEGKNRAWSRRSRLSSGAHGLLAVSTICAFNQRTGVEDKSFSSAL